MKTFKEIAQWMKVEELGFIASDENIQGNCIMDES
jgi:hypothetical protein